MITKTSKITISKIYNLNSIDNIIDVFITDYFLFIISKDLIIHIINRINNYVFSFKVIIFEKEDNILFEFLKIIDIKKLNKDTFEASLLIKNILKGIYFLNIYIITKDNEFKILLNDSYYLDSRFINFINHNSSLNINDSLNDILILVDNGIYNINSKSFFYKIEDILKSTYIDIKDIIYSFFINQNLFFVDKKGFIFIFEIDKDKELKFINSFFLDSFYHKNLKNIKHFYISDNIVIFVDNLIYAISNLDNILDNINEIKIKKYSTWELFKDFYLLTKNSNEIFKDIIFYNNNYYLVFENYLVLLKVEANNFKFTKLKNFEWEKENNLIKLKIINNQELWVFYNQKIWVFQNILENSLYKELTLSFESNQELLSIKDKYNKNDLENTLKEKEILKDKDIFEILDFNNDNILYNNFKVVSIKKYNEFYLIFLNVPFFGILDNKNVFFYPFLFDNFTENYNYKKINIISILDNLLFFKLEDNYYFGELEFTFEPYVKTTVKNINKINTLVNEDKILSNPIRVLNNNVLFSYQNELFILNLGKESKDYTLKKFDLRNVSLSNINYFNDNFVYSFYIKDSNIILKIYELDTINFKINILKEFILENISDFYKNLLINSILLDLKIIDNNKLYLSILKNNQIYDLEITNNIQFKLLKNFKLNVENILNVFKINETIFFIDYDKIYYFNISLNSLNFIKLFETLNKVNLQNNLDVFIFNNLIVIGKIEDFSKWEKIVFTYTNENILDILFYKDKLLIILENSIATDIPNKILDIEKNNFIELLKLDNVIYLKKYFKNKLLKENKLFLLDDIGDFWIVDIQNKDLIKSYLGFLNEGEFYLIDNNIYIITKEGYSIKIEV